MGRLRLDGELGSTGLPDAACGIAARLAPVEGNETAPSTSLEMLDAIVMIEQHNLRIELDRAKLVEALRIYCVAPNFLSAGRTSVARSASVKQLT